MKKTLLAVLLCFAVLSFLSVTALAAGPSAVHTAARSNHNAKGNEDTAFKKIFSNLGPAGDLYDSTNGWLVMGPNNLGFGYLQDIAIPFTPAKNAHITKIQTSLQYYDLGLGQTNAALVAIFKDDGTGLPGAKKASKLVKNLQTFGVGCCTLANAGLATPFAVKAGTQYWVVGTSNSKSADSLNVWDWTFDDAPATFAFRQTGTAWYLLDQSAGYPASAVKVLGTIP